MELTQTGTFLLPDEGPRGRRGKTRLRRHVSCNVPPAHRPALRADAAPAFVAYMLAPESKDVVPGMEVELIISPEQFGTVLKLEGNRVRVDFSASGGKSAVYHTQDELKPKDGAAVGRKQALFCGRDDGLLVAWFLEDLATNNKPCLQLQAHDPGSAVSAIAMVDDYDLVVTAGADASVKVWDPWRGGGAEERAKPLQTLIGHAGGVCDVFYLADYIFSASMDRTVCVWRRDEGREQLQYPWFSRWQSITIGNSVEVWPMSLTAVMLRSLQKARLYVGNSVGELLMFEKEDDFVDGASPAALAHPRPPQR